MQLFLGTCVIYIRLHTLQKKEDRPFLAVEDCRKVMSVFISVYTVLQLMKVVYFKV